MFNHTLSQPSSGGFTSLNPDYTGSSMVLSSSQHYNPSLNPSSFSAKTPNTKLYPKLHLPQQFQRHHERFIRYSSASFSSQAAGSSSSSRVFVGHSIYKGKAALTIDPIPPDFIPLDSGALKLSKEGFVLLQFAPAASVRQYDWSRKQVFSLSVTEVGTLLSLGAKDSCEFFHDPNKGKSDEGRVRKVLKVEPLPDGSGHFFNLSVQNKLTNMDESVYIPVTKAEYTVLISAFNVRSIVKSYRWAPFIPVSTDSSMLSVLLLLSKYRLRKVPVIEKGKPSLTNYITQSAVVRGLENCRGRDWFDCISSQLITEIGLPFMSSDEVISVQSNELVLEAFKRMKDNNIGGLPVVEGQKKKIVGSLSIRDIRFLLLNCALFSNFRKLTVMDFMNTIESAAHDTGRVVTPITCSPGATLGNVIHILASKSVHRIYVAADEEVIGVITLRDVISCFIFEPPNFFDNNLGSSGKEVVVN